MCRDALVTPPQHTNPRALRAGYGEVEGAAYGAEEAVEEAEEAVEATSASALIAGAVAAGVVAVLAGVAAMAYRRRQATAGAPATAPEV